MSPFKRPGVDAEEADAADVGVGHRLEDQGRHGGVRLGVAGRAVNAFDRRPVERRGAGRDDDVGEPVDADQLGGRPDDDREHRAIGDARRGAP